MRFGLARRDGALLRVADRHRGEAQRLRVRVLRLVLPQHRPPVEVEDRDPGLRAGFQRGQGGGPARLRAQAGPRHPEHPCGPYRRQVQLRRFDLQVGGLRQPVEVEGEIVRREDLAERERGRVARLLPHPPVVHAEPAQLGPQIGAEGIRSGLGDHRHPAAQPGRRDGDVGGRAAQELPEGVRLRQRYARFQRVEIHPDAPHRDQVERDIVRGGHRQSSHSSCTLRWPS